MRIQFDEEWFTAVEKKSTSTYRKFSRLPIIASSWRSIEVFEMPYHFWGKSSLHDLFSLYVQLYWHLFSHLHYTSSPSLTCLIESIFQNFSFRILSLTFEGENLSKLLLFPIFRFAPNYQLFFARHFSMILIGSPTPSIRQFPANNIFFQLPLNLLSLRICRRNSSL